MTRQDNRTKISGIRRFGMIMGLLLISSNLLFSQETKYKIVYNVLEDRAKDNYDIYSMNMDGSDKRNITNTPGVEWVYYAYKDKVYYVSDVDTCHRCYFLYEMDADGNNKRKVTGLQLEDSWMSSRNNGTEMIVSGRIGKMRQQLFLVNIKTGNYKQITNDTVSYKNDPVFSPDGNEIILRYRPDNKLRRTVPAELWAIGFPTSYSDTIPSNAAKYQITRFPQADTTTKWFEYHTGPAQHNSKYGSISYMSKQNNQTQIYIIAPGPSNGFLSPAISQLTSGDLSSGWHSWSSDGEWLAMDKSTHEGKNFDIYLMEYRTKKEIRLTNDDKSEMGPVIVEAKK